MARTRNFGDVIRKRLAADHALADRVEEEAINAHIASQIYQWRTDADLTQAALAKKASLSQPAIARLEDSDYDGHSITPLKKIAKALGCKLRVEFYKKPQYVYRDSRTLEWPSEDIDTEISVTVNITQPTT